jgi:integrase/recombinase XerD
VTLWERFIQERVYLKGVSPATVRYYRWVERAFRPILDNPTKAGMLDCIQKLLADGVSPTSCNTYLRGFKAYTLWLKGENHLKEVFKVQFLKTEQKILATFSPQQVQRLVHWKPIGRNQARAHIIALTALDSGLRISELLGLSREKVDFENLVLRVKGKGDKHRLVPISIELRKALFRHLADHSHAKVFCTRTGTPLTVRNSERDFKVMCGEAGITGVRASWHTLRHTFAVNYLRKGGNLYYLQRILGHSSIKTTETYLKSLGIEDLQKVHNGLSLLSR